MASRVQEFSEIKPKSVSHNGLCGLLTREVIISNCGNNIHLLIGAIFSAKFNLELCDIGSELWVSGYLDTLPVLSLRERDLDPLARFVVSRTP